MKVAEECTSVNSKKVIAIRCTVCYRGRKNTGKGHLTKRGNDCQSAMSEMQGCVLENCRMMRECVTLCSPDPLLLYPNSLVKPAVNINPCHWPNENKGLWKSHLRKWKSVEVICSE